MCGICGVIDFSDSSVPTTVLKKMTDAIAHRGPDGEGFYYDRNVGLGHRRLAIIDLSSAGAQPMISKDKKFVISYNGELYNYLELKSELEKLGNSFFSQSDTEVILVAWQQWGPASVEKFNGMFAFALLDSNSSNLFLVRDRYGIKPLYYATFGNKFIFGSEQKAILAHPSVKNVIDKKALYEYFTFQNIFTDRTLVEGIKIIPQGSIFRLNTKDKADNNLYQYWDFHFSEKDEVKGLREYEEELARLLERAVSRQIMSDVSLGSYLSGGMDSGTVSALAAREIPNLKTFTVGFDLSSVCGMELAYDERKSAEAMSAIFKTEHYEMILKAGDMERALRGVSRAIEEPRVGQSYPNFYAAHLASKFVKVVLSGTGGDELFAGYPWRYYRSARAETFEDFVDEYYSVWQRLIPNSDLKKVFSPIWNDVKDVWTRDIFSNVFKNHENELRTPVDFINHSLYFEAKTFLHGLLVVEDKLSMANSLENRVPFLDNDLVDFAMKIPLKYKLNQVEKINKLNENELLQKMNPYFRQQRNGKTILRKVMTRYVPKSITNAKKQGFSAPDASWFQGKSIDFVKSVVYNDESRIYEFMDAKLIRNLVGEHLSGKRNRRLLIWSLLSIESTLNNYES